MKQLLDSLTIRTRLVTLVISTIVMILILSAISIFNNIRIANDVEELNNSILPAQAASQEIRNNVTKAYALLIEASYIETYVSDMNALQEAIGEDLPIERSVSLDRLKEIQEELASLGETNDTEYLPIIKENLAFGEGQALVEELGASIGTFKERRTQAIETALAGADAGEFFSQAIEGGDIVNQNLNNLVDFAVSYGDTMSFIIVEQVNSVILFMGILIVSIIVIVTIISYFITGSMTKPINIMKAALSQIASGDLTATVPTHYKGEFGDMFKSFGNMVRDLNDLILGTKSTSGNVQHSFVDMKNGVEKVDTSITEMDSFLDTLANNMNSQASGIKECSMTMGNIASGIQQIAESSTVVAELATETSTRASDGNTIIEKSMGQMETINQVVEGTSSVVDRLVTRTKSIDEALKSITGIAEQTNLLALNASIEAARAGEQGKGFAVVADEVSKLAAQSKESADEITALLFEINKDTEEAVRAMEQGKIESKQGIEVINQAGQAFNSIVGRVTTITVQVQEVSATVEEMLAGTEEINCSLGEMVTNSEAISGQTMEALHKNSAQMEVVNQMVDVMNVANKGVERLEKGLSKFETADVGYQASSSKKQARSSLNRSYEGSMSSSLVE